MVMGKQQTWEIREATEADLDLLVDIWLEGSRQAHAFIDAGYWEESRAAMRGLYLPLSENRVLLAQGEVQGFVSMMGEYLAALFIKSSQQRLGSGRLLLEHVKEGREKIQLKVYARNEAALRFYGQNGFVRLKSTVDESTGEVEYFMEWRAQEGENEHA